MGGPRLINVFWVQTWNKKGGNIKRSALGELLVRHTRVETANEGRFSSQICSERVASWSLLIKLTHQIFYQGTFFFHSLKYCDPKLLTLISALHFTTTMVIYFYSSGKFGTGKHPFLLYLSTQHSRGKTGKRNLWKSSLFWIFFWEWNEFFHSPKKDQPSSKFITIKIK